MSNCILFRAFMVIKGNKRSEKLLEKYFMFHTTAFISIVKQVFFSEHLNYICGLIFMGDFGQTCTI
jgi:hypothetical protein